MLIYEDKMLKYIQTSCIILLVVIFGLVGMSTAVASTGAISLRAFPFSEVLLQVGIGVFLAAWLLPELPRRGL